MNSPFLIVLMIVAIVIEAIFTPLFLKAQRPGKSKKSLCFKMICSTMFVSVGFLCVAYSGNKSLFAIQILIALCLSWMGDLFLHINDKFVLFAIGYIFFLSAHVTYIITFCKASLHFFPERKLFTPLDIIAIIVILILGVLSYKFVHKVKMKTPTRIGIGLYACVLVSMFVKAAGLATGFMKLEYSNAILGGLFLLVGAFSFLLSDIAMVPLMFGEHGKTNIMLKNHNIGTYFFGQTLLALSVLFINTAV